MADAKFAWPMLDKTLSHYTSIAYVLSFKPCLLSWAYGTEIAFTANDYIDHG